MVAYLSSCLSACPLVCLIVRLGIGTSSLSCETVSGSGGPTDVLDRVVVERFAWKLEVRKEEGYTTRSVSSGDFSGIRGAPGAQTWGVSMVCDQSGNYTTRTFDHTSQERREVHSGGAECTN